MPTSSGLAYRNLGVGLAKCGQRRVKGPPLGWIKVGLDSYVYPDSLHYIAREAKATARLVYLVMWRTTCTGLKSPLRESAFVQFAPQNVRADRP